MPKSKTTNNLSPIAASAAPTLPAKKTSYLTWFFAFWGAVLIIVIIAVLAFKLEPLALAVWLVAMLISLILVMAQLLPQWEGTVQELRTIKETRASGQEDYVTENVNYAFVKLLDGRIKKVRSGGWKVGDHLKKERWEMNVKVL